MEMITVEDHRLWIRPRRHLGGEARMIPELFIPDTAYHPEEGGMQRAQDRVAARAQERAAREAEADAAEPEQQEQPSPEPYHRAAPQYETHTFYRGDIPDTEYWYRSAQYMENAHFFFDHASVDRGYGALPHPTLPMRARERDTPGTSRPFSYATSGFDIGGPSSQHQYTAGYGPYSLPSMTQHTTEPPYIPGEQIMSDLGHQLFTTGIDTHYAGASTSVYRDTSATQPMSDSSGQVFVMTHCTDDPPRTDAEEMWRSWTTPSTEVGTSTIEGMVSALNDEENTSAQTIPRGRRTPMNYSETITYSNAEGARISYSR